MPTHKTAMERPSAFRSRAWTWLVIAASLFLAAPVAAEPSAGASKTKPDVRPPGTEPPAEGPPPLTSDELSQSARALFDAIVHDTPETAESFFFPKEPFLVLKDVTDPAKYHRELVRAFHHDVHQLHGKRRSWDGVTFVDFSLGSAPRWVKPGAEWNKLGYYRTFDAKLRYDAAGAKRSIVVRTIISWEGRWYITHLLPVKH